jgi:hypothetical protein
MSKGKKRRQKGEYTRPQHAPPPPPLVLPPEKAERLRQAMIAYILLLSICWMWEVKDVEDVPILLAATGWAVELPWPQTEDELWGGEPLLWQGAVSA